MSGEIVVSILSRLPPKSVMRFKCVHKSWHSLIISPSFIEKHLLLCNKHSTSIFCKRFVHRDINTNEREVVCSLITFSNDDENDTHFVGEDIHIPPSFDVTTRGQFMDIEVLFAASIIGHCDGTMCIHFGLGSDKIVLWNPAIKDFKILPKQCLTNGPLNSIAFGYDPRFKDYKLINVVDPTAEVIGERLVFDIPRVEVYSLSTNSWREIKACTLETETTMFVPFSYRMYFNGLCYWIGSEKQKEFMDSYDTDGEEEWPRQVIQTFDMSTEIFDHILLPNSLCRPAMRNIFNRHVILWNESVAVFGLYCVGGPGAYGVDAYGLWVLNSLGSVKGSWIKILTLEFEVIPGLQKELVVWKSDEILMVARDGRIFTQNFEAQKFKYLPIDTVHPNNCEAVICVNSIVPVSPHKQIA
ncbi:putative F-box protein At3g23260 [Argentina anserina]|uniref:putative F-box protein At3g23260 n=1 Tax=Argentina anserina TaxID=57926 RepID=UPI0021762F7B|nr:putative F-box protein At3g23260 [Potentilla anserina]